MTEVKFHVNVADQTDYACRLLRKASRQGASVVVTGPASTLARLDRALWTFDAVEFLPHVMPRPERPVPERLAATKIWLLEDAGSSAFHQVLLNLGPDVPSGFESFERLIEIVSADEPDLAAGRARWKHYAVRGYAPSKHEVAA